MAHRFRGQECGQDPEHVACACSLISGASAGRTQKTEMGLEVSPLSHLLLEDWACLGLSAGALTHGLGLSQWVAGSQENMSTPPGKKLCGFFWPRRPIR